MFTFDKETHIYRLGEKVIPGATDLIKQAGFQYPMGNMELGRAVHLACELDDREVLDISSVSDEVYPYLLGWRKFREDTGFKPNRIEEPNINSTLGFASTLDREGTWRLGKAHVLVEIKKYAPTYFTGIQLALQDLTLPQLSLPRDRVAVELKADGDYKIHWFKDKNERDLAFAIVSLFWYKSNHGG